MLERAAPREPFERQHAGARVAIELQPALDVGARNRSSLTARKHITMA